jgi:ankyrin repeat protein
MCHVGYGVAPDSLKALKHLEAASKKNEVARAILNPICAALQPDRQNGKPRENCVTYKNPVILLDSLIWRDSNEDEDGFLTLGPISVDSFRKFEILVKKGRYDSGELAQAFTAACRDGHLEAAMVLAKHCADFSTVDKEMPNSLHWLIMFSEKEACDLLRLVSTSSDGGIDAIKLDGIKRLLATEHENLTVMLPHRCMELRGTPLHWAVTAGYCDLVAEFLRLGADLNLRTQWRTTSHQDGFTEHVPSLSPLDLAVAGHHPRIVELLLDNGSEAYGGDWHWSLSPFHMIGYNIFPFAKYVTHAANYRTALQETIQVLLKHGLDINVLDNQNQTPLCRAVRNMDLESYVIEELIAAGATVVDECEKEHGNVVVMAMMDCAHRRLSWSKIPLLLPLVSDINGLTPGDNGLNALHYCAIFDAAPAAEILLRAPGIDVETKSPQGATAVDLAAQRGSLDVLGQLIEHGANIQGRKPLELSISLGQIDALNMLLEAGADTQWKNRDNRIITCLGYAVRMRSQRPSYVRACLSKCKRLQSQKVIDQHDLNNWTALHFAAYYGDLEGVQALIDYGAGVDKRTLSVNLTPLELAIKTYEELRVYFVGVPHFTGHPRIQQDIDGLDKNAPTYPGMARRIETNFSDSLFEVIRLLQQVERERYPGRLVSDISRGLGKVQPDVYLSQKEIRNHQRDLAFPQPWLEPELEIERKSDAARDL